MQPKPAKPASPELPAVVQPFYAARRGFAELPFQSPEPKPRLGRLFTTDKTRTAKGDWLLRQKTWKFGGHIRSRSRKLEWMLNYRRERLCCT